MGSVSREQFIKAFPGFKKSPDGLVDEILSSAVYKKFSKDTSFYSDGDACEGIGLFLSGEVRVFKIGESGREITLYEIFPGETCILNASCILSKGSYPANAVAVTEGEVLFISGSDFRRLIARHDDMRAFVFSIFSRRFFAIMELIEEVAFGKLDKRLINYLIEKAANDEIEATHQQIANDLGTSREVISRLLKDFERKGSLVLSRGTIRIKDL
ncbi:MAG: Crp/Fnr family transcriptional regulator [Nitrospirota bacterium]|nr:MAG: Crp/Fnr family transcriptional regulator [Nitrospirota bacterium]